MKHKPILPTKFSADLAYLCGLITGDGTLPNRSVIHPTGRIQKRYEIVFISEKLAFIHNVYQPLFKNIFGLKPYVTTVLAKNKKPNYTK